MLNLKTLAAADTYALHLRNEVDEPLYDDGQPVEIVVYGPGTKQWQRAKSAHENRLLQRLQRKGKAAEMTPDEKARTNAEFLTDITAEVRRLAYEDLTGRDMLLGLYSDPAIGFIAEQVHRAVHDWANFSKGSAKS